MSKIYSSYNSEKILKFIFSRIDKNAETLLKTFLHKVFERFVLTECAIERKDEKKKEDVVILHFNCPNENVYLQMVLSKRRNKNFSLKNIQNSSVLLNNIGIKTEKDFWFFLTKIKSLEEKWNSKQNLFNNIIFASERNNVLERRKLLKIKKELNKIEMKYILKKRFFDLFN